MVDQPQDVQRLIAIAQQYDLEGLQRDVSDAIHNFPVNGRPYVATTLVEALARFQDSYVRQAASDADD